MTFELIMLLGFFGTALLGLLPATPARVADESFRGARRERHNRNIREGSVRRGDRRGRVKQETNVTRRLGARRAAA